jgi:hypothetical protein
LGTILLAKTLLPTGKSVTQAMAYMDLAIKTEIILNDITTAILLISLAEVSMFSIGFILFCFDSGDMSPVWLHIIHFPRGIIGYMIYKKLPRSYQLAEALSVPPEKMSFDEIKECLIRGANTAVDTFSSSCRAFLLTYFILSTISMVIDFIGLMI